MSRSIATTEELDITAFQAGIFSWPSDIISPVVIHPQRQTQSLEHVDQEVQSAIKLWFQYAGIAGIGHYSTKNSGAVSLLGRVLIYSRPANGFEMHEDYQRFGEQVMGDELPAGSTKPFVQFLGAKFEYTGPRRLERIIIPSRVFRAEASHADISDAISTLGEWRASQGEPLDRGYQLLVADRGEMKYAAFSSLANLSYREFGTVKADESSLTFTPPGGQAVDFSALRLQGQ